MEKNSVILGKISIHPKGFGFVSPKKGGIEDIFIPSQNINGAIDGDTVEVKITSRSSKGFEGIVLSIKKRLRKQIVGTVIDLLKNGEGIIFSAATGEERDIILEKDKEIEWQIGDRVLLDLIKIENNITTCKCSKYLGNINDATKDTDIAIEEFQIPRKFPIAVIKEAKTFLKTIDIDESRKDLTHLECYTIDPPNARDFDDALSIEKDENGEYHLGVHIADVSFFVRPNSKIDKEALKRGNSTYFIDLVVPMLPEELSNELCSLKENVDRFTASVLIHYSANGELITYKICRSIIRSRKRFTYETAKQILDKKIPSNYYTNLKLLVELCMHLKKQKKSRGCVELEMPELCLLLGENGVPTGKKWIEYDITHQMVEEFMLAANEIVATHLINQGKKSIFRIHEEPDLDNINDFLMFAKLLGFKLSKDVNQTNIQDIFQQAIDSPLLNQLAVKYIRSMKLAIYSKENIGHYGLSLTNYTHFTSPIRRYSDLVIHRLLFEDNYTPNLEEIANKCTESERRSFKGELSVLKLKKIRYVDSLTNKNPNTIFEATITKVHHHGISFNISFINLDGFIHVSELNDDYYIFNQKWCTLTGESTGNNLTIGQRVRLLLTTVNLVFQECTWKIVN